MGGATIAASGPPRYPTSLPCGARLGKRHPAQSVRARYSLASAGSISMR